MSTLLAYLATKTRAEDFATDALAYILNHHAGRVVASEFIRLIKLDFPGITSVRTRTATEGFGIPDIIAETDNGPLLYIENKFWAGLTEHQPRSYLDALPTNGILLFVVPHRRVDYVWRLLIDRLGGKSNNDSFEQHDLRFRIFSKKILAITTWHRILQFLDQKLKHDEQRNLSADIAQLIGLCDFMDEQYEYEPWTATDVSDQQFARKLHGLLNIVDDVLRRAAQAEIIELQRIKQEDSTYAGRDIKLRGAIWAWFGVWYKPWAELGYTPVWLQLYKENLEVTTLQILRKIKDNQNIDLLEDEHNYLFPIKIAPGADRDRVLSDMVTQMSIISDAVLAE